jgi:ABC-type multidrug transport system fused ATPase/permease subunit
LDEGKVVAFGTHDELVATNARYREVLASMSDPEEDDKVN